MDPLTTLYERLRQRGDGVPACVEQPPLLEDWLRYWNDSESDLANLHNFEHWLTRTRPTPPTAGLGTAPPRPIGHPSHR